MPAHAERQRELRPLPTADLPEEPPKAPLAARLTPSGARDLVKGQEETRLKETGPTWAQPIK